MFCHSFAILCQAWHHQSVGNHDIHRYSTVKVQLAHAGRCRYTVDLVGVRVRQQWTNLFFKFGQLQFFCYEFLSFRPVCCPVLWLFFNSIIDKWLISIESIPFDDGWVKYIVPHRSRPYYHYPDLKLTTENNLGDESNRTQFLEKYGRLADSEPQCEIAVFVARQNIFVVNHQNETLHARGETASSSPDPYLFESVFISQF